MFTVIDHSTVLPAGVENTGLHIYPRLIDKLSEYQSCSFVYQIAGDLETALGDQEFSLQVALSTGDQRVIWQSLMHSALALASREQPKAENYFRGALDVARLINHPLTVAHSLNRLGSWLTRVNRPGEGVTLHQEALVLLRQINEQQEVARTFNALGNAFASLGDLEEAVLHFRRAVTLFRNVTDPMGLSSALIGLTACDAQYLNSVSKWAGQDLVQSVKDGEEALAITQKIGWRSGEALASISLGLALGLPGNYGCALKDLQRGLQIARDIKHLHWQILAHIGLGATYLDLHSYQQAQAHLDEALILSAQTQSGQWQQLILGYLVPALIQKNQLEQAGAALSSFSSNTPMETIGQRHAWLALAELRFAQGAYSTALKIVDKLIGSINIKTSLDYSLSRLIKLRGEILTRMGVDKDAEECLTLGLQVAIRQGAQSLVWRFHVLLGRLYWQRRRYSKSERHYVAAHRLVEKLSNSILDMQLRALFLHQASTFIPKRCMNRRNKLLYGGLTKQQYKIAVLIAQKKTNREIAAQLKMSEPGVERHFRNILIKLGFNSWIQIRSWIGSRQTSETSKKDPLSA
jgi:tetratricopeptide (TPR) repeat protein